MSFVVVLPHWSFSISRLLSVPRTLQTSFSGLWGSTSNLSSTLDTFGCLLLPGFSIPSFSHFYRKSFCLVSVYPKVFFTSHTFSPCWHICNSDDSKVKLSMKFLYAWYHRLSFSLPVGTWFWTSDVIVARALSCFLHQETSKDKAKIDLFNMFSYVKSSKYYRQTCL